MAPVIESHIVIDNNDVVYVAGTGYKVRLLAEEHCRGDSAERIQQNHPDLTLGQVYSALSYYYDHKAEMDAEMDRVTAIVKQMRAVAGPSSIAKHLRDEGYLPQKDVTADEDLYTELEAAGKL